MKTTRTIRVVDEKGRIVLPEDLMKVCNMNFSNELALGSGFKGKKIILRRLDDIKDFEVDRIASIDNQRRITVSEVETEKVTIFALNGFLFF